MMMIKALVLALLACSVSQGLDLNRMGGRRRGGFGKKSDPDKIKVSLAVVMPYSMFKQREYKKKISQASMGLSGMRFEKNYDLSPYLEMVQPMPSPTEVLSKICDQFLANQTAAILYLTDSENYGRDTVASQYFMQLGE